MNRLETPHVQLFIEVVKGLCHICKGNRRE